MTKTQSLHLLGALFVAVTFGLASTASATTVSFVNTTAISIPDSGKGNPYPTTINVGPIEEIVVDVNVTLIGLSHTWPDDLYFVLEGPTGASLVLWNDAGGSSDLFGISVIFDDEAAGPIPNFGPVVNPSYQVSQYGSIPGPSDTAPAPNPGFGGDLSRFDGLDPNGNWNLYVYDDASRDSGRLAGGWAITFDTKPIPEPTAAVLFAVGTFVVGGTLRRQRA